MGSCFSSPSGKRAELEAQARRVVVEPPPPYSAHAHQRGRRTAYLPNGYVRSGSRERLIDEKDPGIFETTNEEAERSQPPSQPQPTDEAVTRPTSSRASSVLSVPSTQVGSDRTGSTVTTAQNSLGRDSVLADPMVLEVDMTGWSDSAPPSYCEEGARAGSPEHPVMGEDWLGVLQRRAMDGTS